MSLVVGALGGGRISLEGSEGAAASFDEGGGDGGIAIRAGADSDVLVEDGGFDPLEAGELPARLHHLLDEERFVGAFGVELGE